jgi:hypothetical protein
LSAETAAVSVRVAATVIVVGISMVGISMVGISTIRICAATISMAEAGAYETGAVKTSAVEIAGVALFKKRAVVGVVAIIPIVTVPGREVVIGISGELVFIDHAIAAGVAIGVGVCTLVIICTLILIGALVVIRFLVDRRRCGVDDRRRGYIDTRSVERNPQMGVYVYLGVAFGGDQQTRGSEGGEC